MGKLSSIENRDLLEISLTRRWQELAGACSAVTMRVQGAEIRDEPTLSETQRQNLEKITNPNRRQQWLLARACEQELRKRLAVCAEEKTVLTTVSHSADLVVGLGAVAGKGSRTEKIGVDLELKDRPLSPRVREWLISPGEPEFGLSPIEIWVIKEASYKACLESAGAVLRDFRITSWDPSTSRGRVCIRTSKCVEFSLVRESGWIVTLALSAARGAG